MAFTFHNLDAVTRRYMLQELEMDLRNGKIFLSNRLAADGKEAFPALLREAIAAQDEEWLAEQVQPFLRDTEERQMSGGDVTTARVPVDAHTQLAEGEFNRYYIRGVCARALDEGIDSVEVYRGKQVSQPRAESQAKIGQHLSAQALLDDLRSTSGSDDDPMLGVPAGPNSGLTVRLAPRQAT